jgi:hypothetical protein
MGKDISLDVKTSCKNQNCSVFGELLLSPRTHGAFQKMKCPHLRAFHFLKCLTLFLIFFHVIPDEYLLGITGNKLNIVNVYAM